MKKVITSEHVKSAQTRFDLINNLGLKDSESVWFESEQTYFEYSEKFSPPFFDSDRTLTMDKGNDIIGDRVRTGIDTICSKCETTILKNTDCFMYDSYKKGKIEICLDCAKKDIDAHNKQYKEKISKLWSLEHTTYIPYERIPKEKRCENMVVQTYICIPIESYKEHF